MIVFDLVVMRKCSHSETRRNLRFASCSYDRCHFHPYHSYPEAETHRHWLTEAGETPEFDPFQSDHCSDDRPASFVSWMMQSKSPRFLFEADLDSAEAVAVLARLLDVTVADAEQGSAERLVDLPI